MRYVTMMNRTSVPLGNQHSISSWPRVTAFARRVKQQSALRSAAQLLRRFRVFEINTPLTEVE